MTKEMKKEVKEFATRVWKLGVYGRGRLPVKLIAADGRVAKSEIKSEGAAEGTPRHRYATKKYCDVFVKMVLAYVERAEANGYVVGEMHYESWGASGCFIELTKVVA